DHVQAVVGLAGGKPHIVRPTDYSDRSVAPSPDGERLAYQTSDRHIRTLSLTDGSSTAVPGDPLGGTTEIITWGEDGRDLYLAHYGGAPVQVDRLDLSTGRSEFWKKLMPEDPAAVGQISNVLIAPDGQSYAYSYIRGVVDDLYVVDGLR